MVPWKSNGTLETVPRESKGTQDGYTRVSLKGFLESVPKRVPWKSSEVLEVVPQESSGVLEMVPRECP